MELLFVVGIIAILTAIVLASLNSARGKARDAQRVEDLANIRLALEVYFQEFGEFPKEGEGFVEVIGHGDTIDDIIAPYLGDVPRDPLDDGSAVLSGDGYAYIYDGYHRCVEDSKWHAIIAARKMENPDKGNLISLECSDWGQQGNIGSDGYVILLGQTSD